MTYQLHHGDCINIMPLIERESIDAVICDPPYGLGFMGKDWDHGVPGMHFWLEALRCAKPGAYLLAFGGTRTFHRLAVAIEDAGWEIRDTIMYVYGSGFPKGHDAPWEIHKKACTSCGFMVEYNHEEIESHPTANEGAAIGATREKPQAKHGMRFVRATYLQTPVYACAQCGQVLQPFMSEQESSSLRAAWEKAESIWPEESSMEGRRNSETPEGKLQRCEICTLSSGVYADGAQGWVHHGTSFSDGSIPWQVANADGSRPSYRPQSLEQLHNQFDAFSIERTAQTYRGFNTALKPAFEPIIVARKPITGTVAENVQRYGTGAMNIDACRIEADWESDPSKRGFGYGVMKQGERQQYADRASGEWGLKDNVQWTPSQGRWPANLIHDGSAEVLAGFPMTTTGGALRRSSGGDNRAMNGRNYPRPLSESWSDTGSAARFFYCAKASKQDRDEGLEGLEAKETAHGIGDWCEACGKTIKHNGSGDGCQCGDDRIVRHAVLNNHHPTVKPTALMRYLCHLVTPPQGVILDPFMGSGSTGKAAMLEGFNFIGIDTEIEYVEIAARRIERACEKVGIVIDQPMMFETRCETTDRPKQLILL